MENITATTFDSLATVCMALKCYAADTDFQREAENLLTGLSPGERRQCADIVREDWRTDDVLKQCIDETTLIDRYAWLLDQLQ